MSDGEERESRSQHVTLRTTKSISNQIQELQDENMSEFGHRALKNELKQQHRQSLLEQTLRHTFYGSAFVFLAAVLGMVFGMPGTGPIVQFAGTAAGMLLVAYASQRAYLRWGV